MQRLVTRLNKSMPAYLLQVQKSIADHNTLLARAVFAVFLRHAKPGRNLVSAALALAELPTGALFFFTVCFERTHVSS